MKNRLEGILAFFVEVVLPILFVVLFLAAVGSCGKGSTAIDFSKMPVMDISIKADPGEASVHFIDRKVVGSELDVSKPGAAILVIHIVDLIQIGNKTHEVKWQMNIGMRETDYFRIVK